MKITAIAILLFPIFLLAQSDDPTATNGSYFELTRQGEKKFLGPGTSGQYLTTDGTTLLWGDNPDTDDQTAGEVSITDAGGFYTGTDVEAALQEAALINIANTNLTADADRIIDWSTFDLTFDFDSHALDEFAMQFTTPSGNDYGFFLSDVDGFGRFVAQEVYAPPHLGNAAYNSIIRHNDVDEVIVGNTSDSTIIAADKLFLNVTNLGATSSMEIVNIDTGTDEVGTVDLTPLSGSGTPGVAPRWNGDRYFDYTNAKWYSAWDNENGDGTGDGLDSDDWIILN